MSDVISAEDPVIQILKTVVRRIALDRVRVLARNSKITLHEETTEYLVRSHWMTLILASGKSIRITFKVHFATRDAVHFVGSTFGSEEVTSRQAIDFFKEFCNLTIGGLKFYLEGKMTNVGVSLPLVTRGFDNLFFPPLVGKVWFTDNWVLKSDEAAIGCSVTYELFETFSIAHDDSVDVLETGDVEFF